MAAKKATKKAEKQKRLVLLDAHAILHRAYHALPDFTSNEGEPTGALYGLAAMLIKIINDLEPDYMAACFDLPEPTYRHDAYKEYKAGRAEAEDDLIAQINRSRDVFEAFGIPIYEAKGFEADDVLGTIVEETRNLKNLEVIIASGDMDTLQLVEGKRVKVFTLRKGITDTVLYDEKGVKDRFGFSPKLLPDFKGISGDQSDNIIGIKGIGEKTTTTLIQNFGTIEDIYKKLKKNEDAFREAGIKERMLTLLKEGEEEALFSKMLATIRRDAPIDFSLPKKTWRETIDTERLFALFTELSFRTLAERAKALLNVSGEEKEAEEEPEAPVIDERELKETAIALWLVRSDITNPQLDDILQYAKTNDFAKAKAVVFKALKDAELEEVFENIEKPLIPIIDRMHETGVALDLPYLKKLSKEYHTELSKIEKVIYEHAGQEFNINSPKQLADILFDKLEISAKNQKRTSTGQRSTRESELEKMRDQHPIIESILSYRELQKLLSTYIDNLPNMVGDDGRLHTTLLQAGTTTGRMSSQNPNLQNIPIKSELGRKIRNGFTAGEGYTLLALDYSQIELRVAAVLSGDEKLIEVFRKGGDIHSAVAADVFDVPPEEVDREMRRRAKVINFGILYGMGVLALKQSLGPDTSRADAQKFYNDYFKTYSGLAQYLERVKASAARKGYTETYFGRRRYFDGIRSSIPYIRASAERMAINAPIQGTQSDIIKIAMQRIDGYIEREGLRDDARMLLQVHDELLFEVTKARVEPIAQEIREIMESVLPSEETQGVVFTAEPSWGPNWGELEKHT